MSARAATGIRRATERGAAWNSLHYGTRRRLGLAASRNRALPEICYATERGTKSTAASIGGELEGARRVADIGGALELIPAQGPGVEKGP